MSNENENENEVYKLEKAIRLRAEKDKIITIDQQLSLAMATALLTFKDWRRENGFIS